MPIAVHALRPVVLRRSFATWDTRASCCSMLVETVFPPIPSEAVLPLAGYLVERGEFAFVAVLLASTAGSVLGAVLLYEAARRGGRPFALRFLRFARLEESRLEEAERWFARRGALIVLLGRCVPGMRSLVSLPAGLLRMPRWEYLLFTLLGSLDVERRAGGRRLRARLAVGAACPTSSARSPSRWWRSRYSPPRRSSRGSWSAAGGPAPIHSSAGQAVCITSRTTWRCSRMVSMPSSPGCRPKPQYIATPNSSRYFDAVSYRRLQAGMPSRGRTMPR